MKYIYIISSQPKDSNYLFTRHMPDAVPTSIYAVYDNMQEAVYALSDIYTRGVLGVSKGNEWVIIKHKVLSSRPKVESK